MKLRTLLFALFCLPFSQPLFAQDKLLLRNGNEMLVNVLEITPDSVVFIPIAPDSLPVSTTTDLAKVSSEKILKAAVFSITYQNGNKELMPEPAPVTVQQSDASLYAAGRADAKKLYKAGGVFWATFATSAALPLGGPFIGIPTGAVLTAVNVPDKNIRASEPENKQNLSYLKGYQKQAKMKKLGNAAAGVGAGTGFAVAVIGLLLILMPPFK